MSESFLPLTLYSRIHYLTWSPQRQHRYLCSHPARYRDITKRFYNLPSIQSNNLPLTNMFSTFYVHTPFHAEYQPFSGSHALTDELTQSFLLHAQERQQGRLPITQWREQHIFTAIFGPRVITQLFVTRRRLTNRSLLENLHPQSSPAHPPTIPFPTILLLLITPFPYTFSPFAHPLRLHHRKHHPKPQTQSQFQSPYRIPSITTARSSVIRCNTTLYKQRYIGMDIPVPLGASPACRRRGRGNGIV